MRSEEERGIRLGIYINFRLSFRTLYSSLFSRARECDAFFIPVLFVLCEAREFGSVNAKFIIACGGGHAGEIAFRCGKLPLFLSERDLFIAEKEGRIER